MAQQFDVINWIRTGAAPVYIFGILEKERGKDEL